MYTCILMKHQKRSICQLYFTFPLAFFSFLKGLATCPVCRSEYDSTTAFPDYLRLVPMNLRRSWLENLLLMLWWMRRLLPVFWADPGGQYLWHVDRELPPKASSGDQTSERHRASKKWDHSTSPAITKRHATGQCTLRITTGSFDLAGVWMGGWSDGKGVSIWSLFWWGVMNPRITIRFQTTF